MVLHGEAARTTAPRRLAPKPDFPANRSTSAPREKWRSQASLEICTGFEHTIGDSLNIQERASSIALAEISAA
jgi:hypothetical protein